MTDFDGAVQLERDGYYAEGFVGNLMEEGEVVGLTLSNTPTSIFKTGLPLGTWAAGLGGNTIKASTEHYVVMQDILSDQAFPEDPDAVYPLDNDLVVIGGVYDGQLVSDVIGSLQVAYDGGDLSVDIFPPDAPDGSIDIRDVLIPNESTILENIAASRDYSVTLKDDGKLLFRWGTAVKRPTDLRVRAELALPDAWKTDDAALLNDGKGYRITSAQLIVNHAITNNPNDQIRPEDMENEAATGRTPEYVVIKHPDFPEDPAYALWVAPVNDFSGSGEFYPSYFKLDANGDIVTEPIDGEILAYAPDGTPVGVVNTNEAGDVIGTIFREVTPDNYATSVLLSSDLEKGFTNAWYTTMDRDPFEPHLDESGNQIVGPRWRLKSNKFGQDLPSVEIPLTPHSQPPFTQDNIKYEVGADTTTIINLLDWADGEDSPLAYSNGWTMPIPGAEVVDAVTSEGLRLSDNFDIAFYTKGDIKPAKMYDVQLVMTWETVDLDFGDAPDTSYATLLASDGARHAIVPGFSLGSTVDSENEGQPNADATGDDVLDGNDDEDGVAFIDPLALGQSAKIDVVMSQVAKLDAWIDFNSDGDWDDVGEQVFTSVDLAAGVNHLQISVPEDATITDQTFARFRASSAGGLTPRGSAPDGEVEDYAVSISLAAPTNFTATATSPTTVDLNWDDTSGETSYEVYRWNSTIGTVKIATLVAGSTSYTAADLTPGAREWFQIRAVNGTESVRTEYILVTMPVDEIPTVPADFIATATSTTTALLTWTDSQNESNYEIYRWNSTIGTVKIATLVAGSTSYTAADLTPGAREWFQIRAVNGAESANTEFILVTMPVDEIPTVPGNFAAVALSPSSAQLTWDDSENESIYEIYNWNAVDLTVKIATLPADTTTYTVTGLTPGTNQYFYVKAVNGAESARTEWELLTMPLT